LFDFGLQFHLASTALATSAAATTSATTAGSAGLRAAVTGRARLRTPLSTAATLRALAAGTATTATSNAFATITTATYLVASAFGTPGGLPPARTTTMFALRPGTTAAFATLSSDSSLAELRTNAAILTKTTCIDSTTPKTCALRAPTVATAPRRRAPPRATLATLLEPLAHLLHACLDALPHLATAVAAFGLRHHTLSALFVSFAMRRATATALRAQGDREQ